MIVKYLKDDVWGFIDNIRQVGNQSINCDELVKKYNESPEYQDNCNPGNGEKDIASYTCGEELPADVAYTNKVFIIATNNKENWGNKVHTEDLIDYEIATSGAYAAIVLLYVEEHSEYDSIVLVTNQKCFLMNDKGQTIERLV
jgi:hypothetical protein